ncbi:MAG TPA: PPC domain-containing protein, partial [Pirellulales bacterium]
MPRLAGTPRRRPFALSAIVAVLIAGVVAFAPTAAFAQTSGWPAPNLQAVFPLGGQPGKEVEVSVAGTDLDDAKLVFSNPAIVSEPLTADPKPYQTARPVIANRFKVTIPADCPPGLYDVRTVGRFGASNPRSFVVDPAPDALEVEPNNETVQAQEIPLGGVVNGKTESRGFDYFKFHAKAGQRVLIELWADRLDTRLDGTLVLLDAAGRELASSRDAAGLDPFIDFTAPADGDYLVRLYDFVYQGGDNYAYRLAIGTGPRIDFVMPPLAPKDQPGAVVIYGRNLPGSQPASGVSVDGRPLEMLSRPLQASGADLAGASPDAFLAPGLFVDPARVSVGAFEFRLTTPAGVSNPVAIETTTAPIVLEKEPNNLATQAQPLTVPCEVGGQFYPVNDQDVYAFEAKKGDVLWIEVAAQRLGLAVDPLLVVQRAVKSAEGVESFQDVTTADDPAAAPQGTIIESGDDPSVLFTAPEDGSYRILVRDLYSRL